MLGQSASIGALSSPPTSIFRVDRNVAVVDLEFVPLLCCVPEVAEHVAQTIGRTDHDQLSFVPQGRHGGLDCGEDLF